MEITSEIERHLAGPGAPCACSVVRRTGRALTRRYDEILAPSGLRVTQYAVLSTLARQGPIGMSRLADELATDRTTLTRALSPLQRDGLIRVALGQGRLSRVVELTAAGEAALEQARPLWLDAQAELATIVGPDRLAALVGELAAVETLLR